MNYLYGLIEGLLAGLGEFLPLSSSGHRLMIGQLLDLPAEGHLALFGEIGALLAVLIACRKSLLGIARGIGESIKKAKAGKFRRKKAPRELLLLIALLIACIPPAAAAIVGIFYDYTAAIGQNLTWAGIGFLLSAGLIFIGSHSLCRNWEALELKGGQAFKLGLFRAIAGIVPGLSPIGTTAAMGMNMGFTPAFAAEFSILLSAPSLLGSILWRLGTGVSWSGFAIGPAAISLVVAAVFGVFAIWLLRFLVKREKFGIFMIYSLAAGVAALVLQIT